MTSKIFGFEAEDEEKMLYGNGQLSGTKEERAKSPSE
jgi:hypothetical protein